MATENNSLFSKIENYFQNEFSRLAGVYRQAKNEKRQGLKKSLLEEKAKLKKRARAKLKPKMQKALGLLPDPSKKKKKGAQSIQENSGAQKNKQQKAAKTSFNPHKALNPKEVTPGAPFQKGDAHETQKIAEQEFAQRRQSSVQNHLRERKELDKAARIMAYTRALHTR